MKMTRKEFELYVKDTRKNSVNYNRGRNVVILSEYSVKGQLVLEQGSRYEGTELYDVYSRPSDEKIEAFEDARYMFACGIGMPSGKPSLFFIDVRRF